MGRDSSNLTMHDAQSCTNSIDCNSLNSIEEILTSIESMSKPALSNLAISHRVHLVAKMSLDDLKDVLSDHLCKTCCLCSTFKGCIQVASTLNSTVLSENKLDKKNTSE